MFNQIPIPHNLNDLSPKKQEYFRRLVELQKLEQEMATATTIGRQQKLHHIQDSLDTIKSQYLDHTPEFKALWLAWEATRLAWYLQAFEALKQALED
ncbi:MAG: hypothetical protein KDJ52_00065 [Anaerolineae bacterium]|nr:hypothetical protein [Anaerolineae bacterium]